MICRTKGSYVCNIKDLVSSVLEKCWPENSYDSGMMAKTCSAGAPIAQRGSVEGGSCPVWRVADVFQAVGGQLGSWLRRGHRRLPELRAASCQRPAGASRVRACTSGVLKPKSSFPLMCTTSKRQNLWRFKRETGRRPLHCSQIGPL